MKPYSPFDKLIHDLEPSDLAVLQSVNEGWHIEYKKEIPSARVLAKSISSFANTHGGWLFLGIDEDSKENPVAGSFIGVPSSDLEMANSRLRHGVSDYLSNDPNFESKPVHGPCDEIRLAEGSSIVIVHIPESQTTPHVHKDARIYRRVADGSEPKPESDRFILDELWKRGEKVRKKIKTWVKNDPKLASGEKNRPYLRVLLTPDPWIQDLPISDLSDSDIREIIAGKDVPLDTFYTAGGRFVARQVMNNDPFVYGLSWQIGRDFVSEIIIPLTLYEENEVADLETSLNGYRYQGLLIETLEKYPNRSQPIRVADLNFMAMILIDFVKKYVRLLDLANRPITFSYKIRFLNVWRVVPFVDVESVLDHYRDYGLPVSMDRKRTFPRGYSPESFVLSEPLEGSPSEDRVPGLDQAIGVLTLASLALAVPALTHEKDSEVSKSVVAEMYEATIRAKEVQRKRNIRLGVFDS